MNDKTQVGKKNAKDDCIETQKNYLFDSYCCLFFFFFACFTLHILPYDTLHIVLHLNKKYDTRSNHLDITCHYQGFDLIQREMKSKISID